MAGRRFYRRVGLHLENVVQPPRKDQVTLAQPVASGASEASRRSGSVVEMAYYSIEASARNYWDSSSQPAEDSTRVVLPRQLSILNRFIRLREPFFSVMPGSVVQL